MKKIKMSKMPVMVAGGMVGMSVLAGGLLVGGRVLADDVVDQIEINVPVSCTMSGSGMTSHSAEIANGTINSTIGTTTINASCNDSNGFAIYTIGFTDDTEGKNVLTNATLGSTYDIATGTGTSGNSQWAMKVTTQTDPEPAYPVAIQNSFDSFHTVPGDYTMVAKREAGTDIGTGATGSTITTTYQVYISNNQPAGTYAGQVKYVLVHPNDATTPQKRLYMQTVTDEQLATLMPNEGDSVTLYDKRDESDYTVAKIADTYWMTQNLRITGVISAENSNFTGEDYNVSVYDLKTNGASGGECNRGYDNACNHLPDADDLVATGLTAKQIGAWYNYASASAGTITGESNSAETSEDICPAGWHLPNYDTTKPAGSINSLTGETVEVIQAFSPVTGGYYNNGTASSIELGFWWSSSALQTYSRQYLGIYENGSQLAINVNGGQRYNGFYIRCVR